MCKWAPGKSYLQWRALGTWGFHCCITQRDNMKIITSGCSNDSGQTLLLCSGRCIIENGSFKHCFIASMCQILQSLLSNDAWFQWCTMLVEVYAVRHKCWWNNQKSEGATSYTLSKTLFRKPHVHQLRVGHIRLRFYQGHPGVLCPRRFGGSWSGDVMDRVNRLLLTLLCR